MAKNKINRTGMKEDCEPIKTISQLNSFCHELLKHGDYGRRNFTAFILGVKCLLRPSDIFKLGFNEVYTPDGKVRENIKTRDKKTNKNNLLWLGSSKQNLEDYYQWYVQHGFHKWYQNHPEWYQKAYSYYYKKYQQYIEHWNSKKHPKGRKPKSFIEPPKSGWLFPKRNDRIFPMNRNSFYIAIRRAADKLGMPHITAESCRKCGAYFAYKQNNNDIGLVQSLMNHSSPKTSLFYLGLQGTSKINKLKHIKY